MIQKLLKKSGLGRSQRRLILCLLIAAPFLFWSIEYGLSLITTHAARPIVGNESMLAFTEPGFDYRKMFSLLRRVQRVEQRQAAAPSAFFSRPENRKLLLSLKRACLDQKAEVVNFIETMRRSFVSSPVPYKLNRRLQHNLAIIQHHIQVIERLISFFPATFPVAY